MEQADLVLFVLALGDKQHHQSDDAQTSHSQHHPQGGHVAAVAGGGGIGCGGLLRLLGLAGLNGSGRLLSAAAAALAILVVVTQSGNHLALLHDSLADLADLVAGVAVLGAGGVAYTLLSDFPSRMRLDDIARNTRSQIVSAKLEEDGTVVPLEK